ncbi:MAG: hypothetical protein ACKOHG_07470, partial [Planctomycetia bacterium]
AGYVRVRIDGTTMHLDDKPSLDRKRKSRIEIVLDRVTANPADRSRLDALRDRRGRRARVAGRGAQPKARLPIMRPGVQAPRTASVLVQ